MNASDAEAPASASARSNIAGCGLAQPTECEVTTWSMTSAASVRRQLRHASASPVESVFVIRTTVRPRALHQRSAAVAPSQRCGP